MSENKKPNYLPAVVIWAVFEAVAVALWLGLGNLKWHACLDTVLTFERKPQFFPVLELMPPEAAR